MRNLLKEEDSNVIRIKTLDFEEDYESVINYLEGIFIERAREFKIEIKNDY